MNGDNDKTKENTGAQNGTEETLNATEDTVDDIKQSAAPTKSNPGKDRGFGFSAVILMLILVAVGGLGWYSWMYYLQPQQQRLQVLEESLNHQLELSDRLNNQQQLAAKVSATTEKLLANLRNDQTLVEQRLESHNNRLRDLSGTSRNDWMLAEAKYLLRLASQRLLMERGTVGAQALLESTDEILAAIDDVDLFIVRDAVAKDLIALKLAPTIDREGIYLQLAALINAVEKLPPIPPVAQRPPTPTTDVVEAAQTDPTTQAWYSQLFFALKNVFTDLGQFIKIRHHDKPPEPLLSDQHQAYLTHNLRLMFEQSQLALLREQPTIYQQSLEQAKQWLNQYYAHYPEKDILVKEVSELQQRPIVQVLPDISGSLEQLIDYIDRYHKLTPESIIVEEAVEKIADKEEMATERPLVPPASVESKGVAPQEEYRE